MGLPLLAPVGQTGRNDGGSGTLTSLKWTTSLKRPADRRSMTTAVVAGIAAVLLAGCTPGQGAAGPTPTWSCLPDGTDEPCTAEKALAQAEEAEANEAYDAAMLAYREFMAERNRLMMEGGTPSPTPEMERLASGEYLDSMGTFLASAHEAGRRTSGPIEVTLLEPLSYHGDQVKLTACEDARGVYVVDGPMSVPGRLGAVTLLVERSEQGWKIAQGADADPSRCP